MIKNLKRQVSEHPKSLLSYVLQSILVITFFSYFFYKSLWAIPFMIPFGIGFFLLKSQNLTIKTKREFEKQFKECISSVAAGLKAGYSVENAFQESISDMKLLFGERAAIVTVLEKMVREMHNNKALEEVLFQLCQREDSAFIREFSDVFQIAKRSGGNMTAIIGDSVEAISNQIHMEQEMLDMISGKKLEQKIMNVIPFMIAIYVQSANPGYFDILYHSGMGTIVMTVCLLIYIGAFVLSEKISSINIG